MKRLWRTLGTIALGMIFLTGCGGDHPNGISDIQPTAIVGSETDVWAQDGGDYAQDGEDYAQNREGSAQSGERITLTLGAVNVSWQLESAVDVYNAQSKKYYVEIVDYLPESYDSAIREASEDRFKMDLATGKGTDIVSLGAMIPDELGYTGVLTDLNTFLTDEAEQEKYLGNILECVQTGDALYAIAPAFWLELIVGDGSKIGMENGWTLEEMLESFKRNGKDIAALAKGGALPMSYFTAYSIDDFVDWDTGTADFCNEEFYRLLEFAKTADTGEFIRPTRESVSSGTHLASCEKLVSMGDVQYFKWLFGENMVVKGYPGHGTGVAVEMGYQSIGICSYSQYPEGAWDFLEFYLGMTWLEKLDHYESCSDAFGGFPISRQVFEEELKNSMRDHEDGRRKTLRWGEGDTPSFYINTQEDVDDLRKVIVLADRRAFSVTSVIIGIVEEEVSGYYAGTATAEQTAQKIQNRVQLYLDEQRT